MPLAHHIHTPPAPGNGLMSQQAPAPQPSQATELVEWANAAQAAYSIAESLVQTSFVPAGFREKPYEATAAILAGAEVGLSPMASLRSFDIIQGVAAPRAITLRAIVQSQGHEVWVEETTDSRAIVCGRRKGSQHVEKSVWTLDRARKMKLDGKAQWAAQPKAMLIARATSEVCRLIAADAILGLPYSIEELNDGAAPEYAPQSDAEPQNEPQPAPTRTVKRAPARKATAAVTKVTPTERAAEDEVPLPGEDDFDEEPAAEEEDTPLNVFAPATAAQNRKMHALFRDAEVTDRDERLKLTGIILERNVDTSSGLSKDDANKVIDKLEAWGNDGNLADLVAAILANGGEVE